MAPLRVLLCGHVTLDRYGDALVPGGSVYYAGHAWRALGAEVRVLTAAGPDFDPAALAGLEALVLPAPATTRFVNAHHPDGTRSQRVEAVAAPLAPEALPPGWRRPDVLHLAPVMGETDLPAWRAAVQARFTGLGVQGWVRAAAGDGRVLQPRWAPAPAALAGVDAATVGDDDLRGQGDLLDRLVAAIPVVAATHGERGCEVLAGGARVGVGIHPAQTVDPVGAGDVFSAGFFLGLASGEPPVEAARLGAAAASIVVEARAGEALGRVGEAWRRRLAVPPLPRR